MKYLFVPQLEEIPEWKECYYDYETLNFMIEFIEKCEDLYERIQIKMISTSKPMRKHRLQVGDAPEQERLKRTSVNVRQIM